MPTDFCRSELTATNSYRNMVLPILHWCVYAFLNAERKKTVYSALHSKKNVKFRFFPAKMLPNSTIEFCAPRFANRCFRSGAQRESCSGALLYCSKIVTPFMQIPVIVQPCSGFGSELHSVQTAF